MSGPRLVLASGSPRRRELLTGLGLQFDVSPADLDEQRLPEEAPAAHVERLALEKARLVAARRPGEVVIGGDTVVVLDGEILTKPGSPEEATDMLLRLQGRAHRVETGVAVVVDGRAESDVVATDVSFRPFDRSMAEAYVATGEPLDKAGGYGIQGLGSVLVESIRGDYFAVVGLPVARLAVLLERIGLRYDFRGLTSVSSNQG